MARHKWVEQRKNELLPIPYFHAVFTVPPAIAEIALRNKKTLFQILFRASAQTLLTIAADPKHGRCCMPISVLIFSVPLCFRGEQALNSS